MTQALALIPASIRHLWQDALDFIADLLEQADRDLLRAGIRRSAGAQLSIWINGAESALRRLILIAALALNPAPLKPHVRHTPTPRANQPRPRSFSVFRLHGASISHGVSRRAPTPPPHEASAHIRFPADPMLALGRVTKPPNHLHNGGPRLSRAQPKHPLDRWGRLSRNDPDWRPPPERPFVDRSCLETEPNDRYLYGFEVVRIPRPRNKPSRLDSTPDWRRCYDEWEKPVPAPNFIARLDALARASAHADALIRRTARRLQSQRERTLALARTARPATRLPRRVRRLVVDEGAHDMACEAHGAFDSS